MERAPQRRHWWMALGAVGVLTLAGAAYAATGGTGKLHGCTAKRTGALRLARTCKKSEKAVSWNVAGPTGPRGAPGTTGGVGPQGPGAKVFSFDSVTPQNTSTPAPATIGQFGGYTFSAACFTNPPAVLNVAVDEQGPGFTFDGINNSTTSTGNSAGAGSVGLPATSSPTPVATAQAAAGKSDTEGQFGTILPNSGSPFEINFLVKVDQTVNPARCHASIAITPAS